MRVATKDIGANLETNLEGGRFSFHHDRIGGGDGGADVLQANTEQTEVERTDGLRHDARTRVQTNVQQILIIRCVY